MVQINSYIKNFDEVFWENTFSPWNIVQSLDIESKIRKLGEGYNIVDNIAIHKTATIESNVTIKAPAIIGRNCFIWANSYLRNGVFLWSWVNIGIWCEIKSSIILDNSAIAHMNFIGDSIIWSQVNFEWGSLTANHYNERENKDILVKYKWRILNTHIQKFGALVWDNSKIWANAVLSPGTILESWSVVKRLELIEQVKNRTLDTKSLLCDCWVQLKTD